MAKMSDFRRAMERSSKRAVTEMHNLAIASHGNYGTHNKKRLDSALKTMGLHHLIGKTLLTPSVHAEHSNQLGQRYLKRLEYVQQKAADPKMQRELLGRANASLDEMEKEIKEVIEKHMLAFVYSA